MPQVVFPNTSSWLSIFLYDETLIMDILLHNLVEFVSRVS